SPRAGGGVMMRRLIMLSRSKMSDLGIRRRQYASGVMQGAGRIAKSTAATRTTYRPTPRSRAYTRQVRRHEVISQTPAILRKQPVFMSSHKYKLALLISAHNESVVLAATLRSAIAAGMAPEHIYVVDDYSTDHTS